MVAVILAAAVAANASGIEFVEDDYPAALAQEYRVEGLTGVSEAVQERDRTPGALDYGLEGPGGGALGGRAVGNRLNN